VTISATLRPGARDQFDRDALILDRVVQQGGYHRVRLATFGRRGNEASHFEHMIDVWLRGLTLAALVDVPAGSRVRGLHDAG